MGLHHMFVGPAKPLVIGVITRKARCLLQLSSAFKSYRGPMQQVALFLNSV